MARESDIMETESKTGSSLPPCTLERAEVKQVRAWRADNLKLKEIQARCRAEGITSRSGMTPSLETLSRWCLGIEVKVKRDPPSKPRAPKLRLEQRPQNKALIDLIKSMREVEEGEEVWSFDKIAARANEKGYTTSRGKPLSKTQIIRVWKHFKAQPDG